MKGSPLVIVGIGGSGTRAFARLAEATGRHMGDIQNDSNDALALYQLADKWCEPAYRAWKDGDDLPGQSEFEADLAASVAEHRRDGAPDDRWGWKQPRSIHLLPALATAYPDDLLVLHVMRDGRDVALGKTIHLQLTGAYSIPASLYGEPVPIQLAHLWATANSLAADFGERLLRGRYLRVSLEELCVDVERVANRILAFIGGEIPSHLLRKIIQPPDSIGRWRNADPELVARIVANSREALQRFGYEG